MGWMSDLLKEIPSAARYKAELEKLASDYERLKSENADLKSKLQTVEEENRHLKEQLSEEIKTATAKSNEEAKKRAKGYSVQ